MIDSTFQQELDNISAILNNLSDNFSVIEVDGLDFEEFYAKVPQIYPPFQESASDTEASGEESDSEEESQSFIDDNNNNIDKALFNIE